MKTLGIFAISITFLVLAISGCGSATSNQSINLPPEEFPASSNQSIPPAFDELPVSVPEVDTPFSDNNNDKDISEIKSSE